MKPQLTITDPAARFRCLRSISAAVGLLVFLLSVAVTCPAHAQQAPPWEQYLDRVMNIEDVEEDDRTAIMDQLSDLAEHPINLNRTTRSELEQLPFLTPQQVQDIVEYLYRYGPMKSLGELAMISSLDWDHQQLLRFFVRADGTPPEQAPPSHSGLFAHPRHELVGAFELPFYERRGDRKGYLGYPYRHWLRYTYASGGRLRAGLTGAQDAGEPFMAGRNGAGYDFYSAFVEIRGAGPVRTAVTGRYRLKFGHGLILNTAQGFGKLFALSSLGRAGTNLRGYSSRAEASYLQGAAATIALRRHVDMTLFASYRSIDATLNADSTSVATLLRTGLHRTEHEMERKHNTRQWLAGGHVEWNGGGLHAGLTALGSGLDRALEPDGDRLRYRYSPRGSRFWNVSADYGYTSHRFSVSGETATGDAHAIATINTVSLCLADGLSLMVLQRFYSCRYYALFSRTFSEGGHTQNESGCYAGITWNPGKSLSLMAYTDYVYFAWARYGVSRPSHAWDNLVSAAWQHGILGLQARYRVRLKQQDNDGATALDNVVEQRARLALTVKTDGWDLRTQADMALSDNGDASFGWMVTQQLGYRSGRLQIDGHAGYFDTDDWRSRVYAYERGLYYTFSFPAFSGRGLRYALRAQWAFGPHLTGVMRLTTTDYLDRDHISSGLQQIDRSAMTELELQFLVRL